MNPAGRGRCNIAPIVKAYSRAAQLAFDCCTSGFGILSDCLVPTRCFLLKAPARPGLSFVIESPHQRQSAERAVDEQLRCQSGRCRAEASWQISDTHA